MSALLLLKSAYELKREAKIRRNEAKLRELGLSTSKAEMASAVAKPRSTSSTSSSSRSAGGAKSKPKRRRSSSPPPPRRAPSRRVRGQKPEHRGLAGTEGIHGRLAARGDDGEDDDGEDEDDAAYEANRMLKYEKLLAKHDADGVKLPPRATYAHTVHRVLSMSEKALQNRVRAIERAQGVYAILKMRMFAEVLILEGYDEVATAAEAALQRLLELPRFAGELAQSSGAKAAAS